MQDEVEKPDHYQFGQMEAWDIIELAVMDIADPVTAYHVASALKYLLRAARKGGDTDIAKASAHLKRETARHVTAAPDYDPDSVAFHAADRAQADKVWDALGKADAADGASEYGSPVTPGCATPPALTGCEWRPIW
jgi:hypothetical protein